MCFILQGYIVLVPRIAIRGKEAKTMVNMRKDGQMAPWLLGLGTRNQLLIGWLRSQLYYFPFSSHSSLGGSSGASSGACCATDVVVGKTQPLALTFSLDTRKPRRETPGPCCTSMVPPLLFSSALLYHSSCPSTGTSKRSVIASVENISSFPSSEIR